MADPLAKRFPVTRRADVRVPASRSRRRLRRRWPGVSAGLWPWEARASITDRLAHSLRRPVLLVAAFLALQVSARGCPVKTALRTLHAIGRAEPGAHLQGNITRVRKGREDEDTPPRPGP